MFGFRSLKRFAGMACLAIGLTNALSAQSATVFENVNVVTMTERGVLTGQQVFVDGDRIVAIGKTVEAPDDAVRIDGAGKYLVPGFAEMHGHIPNPNAGGEQAIKDTLFLYVANGVTTVRGMLGAPGQLDLREAAKRGEIISPTLYLAGPSFNGNSVNSEAGARRKVSQQKAEGWDLMKIHPGLTLPEYKAMAERAHIVGIEFGGHIPEQVGLEEALNARQRTIEHLDGYIPFVKGENERVSDAVLHDAAIRTKEAGVAVVPTVALWKVLLKADSLDRLLAFPELKYINKRTRDGWVNFYKAAQQFTFLQTKNPEVRHENRQRLLREMDKVGVEILFGTDAPQVFSVPGFSIHREIGSMQEAGLSNETILKSATVAVGNYFADKDVFGKLAPGQRADMMLVGGNPLADLTALKEPAGVMVRGRWLSREVIDAELAEIAKRAAQ